MFRISKLTDYGIVLLTHIARGTDAAVHSARDLAEESRLPLPTVTKILKTLVRGEILASHRGVHGGFALARSASDITLASIICAIDGPMALTDCSSECTDKAPCDIEARCPVKANWRAINRAVVRAFESVTLSDMANPIDEAELLSATRVSARTRRQKRLAG